MAEGLSEREREILREVVELYLANGEPIASAVVARGSSTALSAASIRTVMAELEEKGFLKQPHTSAGRVPSDLGFRLYVHGLLVSSELPEGARRRLRSLLAPTGALEEQLAQVSRVLAQETFEVGVALAPAPQQAALRAIHFVKVSPSRVLAVVVTRGGLVDSRLLSVGRDFTPAELERVSNYCTESFAGLPLTEIRARLLTMMTEERAQCDQIFADVLDLARQAVDTEVTSGGGVFFDGADRFLERVDASQLENLRRLFAAFSDKALLLALLNQYVTSNGPRVFIGSEFSLAGADDLGLIVTSFELASGERGLVGVIGLKRMNYPQIIPVVDFVGHYLADAGRTPGGIG